MESSQLNGESSVEAPGQGAEQPQTTAQPAAAEPPAGQQTAVQQEAKKPAEKKPDQGFEIEIAGGAIRRFQTADEVRSAILAGEVQRTANIRNLSAPAGAKPATVEAWAKSNDKLRPLYAPVWSVTLKGALYGAIAVFVLKALDTMILLFRINPLAGILWLLIGAFFFSPKWKIQIAFIAGFIWFQSHASVNIMALSGSWFGVLVFAAVFGISSGMAVGTLVGAVRARSMETAPDAPGEGFKPALWGFAVPAAVFLAAGYGYFAYLMPYLLSNL
jgi:hypothetical protein